MVCKTTIPQFKSGWHLEETPLPAGFSLFGWYTKGMSFVARDLMEPNVLTIPAAMRFREIQHLLVQAACYGAPVVDEAGKVIGVISAMDLLRAADQAFDDDLDPDEGEDPSIDDLTAIELATPEPIWISPDTPAREIAELMRAQGIHRVLVGTNGKLEGMVSAIDLGRAIT